MTPNPTNTLMSNLKWILEKHSTWKKNS